MQTGAQRFLIITGIISSSKAKLFLLLLFLRLILLLCVLLLLLPPYPPTHLPPLSPLLLFLISFFSSVFPSFLLFLLSSRIKVLKQQTKSAALLWKPVWLSLDGAIILLRCALNGILHFSQFENPVNKPFQHVGCACALGRLLHNPSHTPKKKKKTKNNPS